MSNQPNGPICRHCKGPRDPERSYWDLCLACLDAHVATMRPHELETVPGAVFDVLGLDKELFLR